MSLLHSDYDFNYIKSLKLKYVTNLLLKAHENKVEERIWQQWLVAYSRMDGSTFIPYSEWKDKLLKPKIDDITDDEVIAMAEQIKAIDQRSTPI